MREVDLVTVGKTVMNETFLTTAEENKGRLSLQGASRCPGEVDLVTGDSSELRPSSESKRE